MYASQSKSSVHSWLNVKELFGQNWPNIWSLSDSNGTQTSNHLVYKQRLNHIAEMAELLSCAVSTYLYGAFDCMFLSIHERVLGWVHTP